MCAHRNARFRMLEPASIERLIVDALDVALRSFADAEARRQRARAARPEAPPGWTWSEDTLGDDASAIVHQRSGVCVLQYEPGDKWRAYEGNYCGANALADQPSVGMEFRGAIAFVQARVGAA